MHRQMTMRPYVAPNARAFQSESIVRPRTAQDRVHTPTESVHSSECDEPAVCPHCMVSIDKVYVLTDVTELDIRKEEMPHFDDLDVDAQYHRLRNYVEQLGQLLRTAQERLTSLSLERVTEVPEASRLPRERPIPVAPVAMRRPRLGRPTEE